jgi:hypothetical protein
MGGVGRVPSTRRVMKLSDDFPRTPPRSRCSVPTQEVVGRIVRRARRRRRSRRSRSRRRRPRASPSLDRRSVPAGPCRAAPLSRSERVIPTGLRVPGRSRASEEATGAHIGSDPIVREPKPSNWRGLVATLSARAIVLFFWRRRPPCSNLCCTGPLHFSSECPSAASRTQSRVPAGRGATGCRRMRARVQGTAARGSWTLEKLRVVRFEFLESRLPNSCPAPWIL